MDNELIIENLTPEDIVLLREALKEIRVPIGNTLKYIHLTNLLEKLDSIVESIYE